MLKRSYLALLCTVALQACVVIPVSDKIHTIPLRVEHSQDAALATNGKPIQVLVPQQVRFAHGINVAPGALVPVLMDVTGVKTAPCAILGEAQQDTGTQRIVVRATAVLCGSEVTGLHGYLVGDDHTIGLPAKPLATLDPSSMANMSVLSVPADTRATLIPMI